MRAVGREDEALPLQIAAARRDSSETLDIHVWGMPPDSFLSAGRRIDAGHWMLSPDGLTDLAFIPPANFSGAVDLRIAAETKDGEDRAVAREHVSVAVTPVADLPRVAAAPAVGREDTPIPLEIEAASTDPSEVVTVTVARLPSGAKLTQGREIDDGVITLTAQELADVSLLPPTHFNGELQLAVTATSSDAGRNSSVIAPLDVTVEPAADRPSLAVRDAIGIEDGIVALDIEAAPTDPGEQLVVSVAGLPAGSTLSSGIAVGDTAWEVVTGLQGLSLVPPADYSGQFELRIAARSIDGEDTATTEASMKVGIVPVADAPDLVARDVSGAAGQPLPLAISIGPSDGRETVTLSLFGLPDDFVLSSGQATGSGEWLLQPADLEGLAILPPLNRAGTTVAAQVRATATDGSDRALIQTGFEIAVTSPGVQPPQQSVSLVPPANAAVQSAEPLAAAASAEQVSPPSQTIPAVAAVRAPEAAPPDQIVPEDPQTVRLIARAESFVDIGDIAAARLLYEAAAGAGSANAAFGMGRTYDPVFHQTKGLVGVRPDPTEAMRWYRRARDDRQADAAKAIARLRAWADEAGVVLPSNP